MPLYTLTCSDCGREDEQFRAIDERNEPRPCVDPTCEGTMERKLEVGRQIWAETQWRVSNQWRKDHGVAD